MKKYLISILFFIVSCNSNLNTNNNFTNGSVKFISAKGVPVLKGTLNGKPAYFIMDSGASLSVLDSDQSKDYGFNVYADSEDGMVAGYGGTTQMESASNVNIEIGGVKFIGDYKSQDISNIVSAISKDLGIHISGIIGSDIMSNLGIIIDFGTESIELKSTQTK